MCLWGISEIAKADKAIECYKVVLLKTSGEYITPYEEVAVPPDIIAGKAPFVAKRRMWEISPKESPDDFIRQAMLANSVGSGFIHTYQTLDEVRKDKTFYMYVKYIGDQYLPQEIVGAKIFKCIIPIDAVYCVGHVDLGVYGYASTEICFIEEVTDAFNEECVSGDWNPTELTFFPGN